MIRALANVGALVALFWAPLTHAQCVGAQNYYVDASAGSDSTNCISSGAGACSTIQAAINRIPKTLKDQATVNIAAGNYAGFIVSGFGTDYGFQQATGGLLISGTLANSTLASGSATGTATSGTAGGGTLYGTLVNTGAAWTAGDLVGRLISTSSPTNNTFVIDSNTATSLTVTGFWAAPTSSTTYTIQDPATVINAGVALPATPISAAISNRAGIEIFGNNVKYLSGSMVVRNLRVATSSPIGIEITDNSAIALRQLQVRQSSSTATGISIGALVATSAPSVATIQIDVAMSPSSTSGSALVLSNGSLGVTQTLFRNVGSGTGDVGLALGTTGQSWALVNSIFSSSVYGFANGVRFMAGSSNSFPNNKGNHITCANSSGVAMAFGPAVTAVGSAPNQGGPHVGFTSIQTHVFSTCGIGIQASGGASVDITSVYGSVATTGIAVNTGALVTFAQTPGLAAGVNQINLDNGAMTPTYAGIALGFCASTADFGSRVCAR